MDFNKRITIFCGHYGSGKTGIALNTAFELKKRFDSVLIADIDIVNPYFRTKDSEKQLNEAGIRLISSAFANSNVDVPALPQEIYRITDELSARAVIDVGGDDRGAVALGRLREKILSENDYEMIAVINFYRPLTRTARNAFEIMREIETASKIPFTGIINNSNLGAQTSAQTILDTLGRAAELENLSGLKVKMTTVKSGIFKELQSKVDKLYPLEILVNSGTQTLF